MLQDSASLVLSRYPLRVQPISRVRRLGNAGGSSGATLWQYRAADGEMALRAWPRHGPTLARLEMIHGWLGELSGLGLVPLPVPLPARDGRTVQHQDGLYWELAPWLPGTPRSNVRQRRVAFSPRSRLWPLFTGDSPAMGSAEPVPAFALGFASSRNWPMAVSTSWSPPWSARRLTRRL